MGFKCSYTAISAGIPRDDILGRPEGGPERAAIVVRQFFGEGYAYDRLGWDVETYPANDAVWAGTWGDTILFSTAPETLDGAQWSLPDGFGRWDLSIHSVVDLCRFEVSGGPFGGRDVSLWPDMEVSFDEACSGRPLPFEEPYLRGEHPEDPGYPLPFHPLELGNAAVAWMLGIEGETPPDDTVIVPVIAQIRAHGHVALHRFAPAASEPEPKKGLIGRVLGR